MTLSNDTRHWTCKMSTCWCSEKNAKSVRDALQDENENNNSAKDRCKTYKISTNVSNNNEMLILSRENLWTGVKLI